MAKTPKQPVTLVRKNRRGIVRRRNLVIAVSLLAVVVTVGEFSVRAWLGGALRTTVQSMLGGQASVGIGSQPALLDVITGTVPALSIHETQVGVCKIQDVTIDATLDNARRQSGHLSVSATQASLTLPPQAISTLLGRQLGGTQPTVTPMPTQDELDVQLYGLLDVYEKPTLSSGGVISFAPVSVSMGGFAAPGSLTGQIIPKAKFQQKLPHLPLAMQAQGVQVTSAGVVIVAAGQAAQSQPAGHGATTASGLRTC